MCMYNGRITIKIRKTLFLVNLYTGGYIMEKKWLLISENSEKSPDSNDTVSLDEWENEGGRIVKSMK